MKNHTAGNAISPREAARLAAQAAARYYERAHAWRFDPFHHWDQLLLIVLLALVVAVLLCYWRPVLRCLCGDDTIRCDRFYLAYWGLLECCGACDGAWTRSLSSFCCACCPDLAGRNLKQWLGEQLGIYPIAVRVSNIVVGRLPQDSNSWFARNPDLFVQVIPDELQPRLNTELISEANIECVQFTCSLTLLLKNNTWESPVRFVVKKMTLTRSKDVAECFISPTRLIDWARHGEKVRIQMGGPCRTWDPTCTPWILMELSLPMEATGRRQEGSFQSVITKFDTKKQSKGVRSKNYRDENNINMEDRIGFSPLPVTIETSYREFKEFKEFKEEYPLWNAKGVPMAEHEDTKDRRAHRWRGSVNVTICWATLLLVGYAAPRLMSSSCFEEYRRLLVTKRYCEHKNMTFPAEDEDVEDSVVQFCKALSHRDVLHLLSVHMLRQGRGSQDDLSQADLTMVCFPSPQETVSSCEGEWPSTLKRPRILGFFECPSNSCRFSEILEESFLDYIILGLLVVLGFGACICACLNVKNERRERQVSPSEYHKELPPNFDSNNIDTHRVKSNYRDRRSPREEKV